jgi:cytochrome c oxidase subunit IV
MSAHSSQDIHDETNYDPTVWIPEQHSHGTRDIWIKFWILLGITIFDVILYFALPPSMMRNVIFIAFGIVKAIFIVGTFMHMKHERLSLASMIIVPMVFVIFFVYWMIFEGNFWGSF